MDKKNIFKIEIGLVLIELNQIFPMKSLEFKISLSVASYNKKTDENCRNVYVSENRIVYKLLKISIANIDNTN